MHMLSTEHCIPFEPCSETFQCPRLTSRIISQTGEGLRESYDEYSITACPVFLQGRGRERKKYNEKVMTQLSTCISF